MTNIAASPPTTTPAKEKSDATFVVVFRKRLLIAEAIFLAIAVAIVM